MNIFEIVLLYHKTLFNLSILDQGLTQETHDSTDCILSPISNINIYTNLWGTTRCKTTTDIFLDGFLFKDKQLITSIVPPPAGESGDVNQYLQMVTEECNLIYINIVPDHMFYLYKITTDWVLLSSWMYFYNFTILQIKNISTFINSLYTYFGANDKSNVHEYQLFLQKYFFYKFSFNKDSIFITNNINTLYYFLNNSNHADSFAYDYNGPHTIKQFISYKLPHEALIDTFKKQIKTYYTFYFKATPTVVVNDTPPGAFQPAMKNYLDDAEYDTAIENISIKLQKYLQSTSVNQQNIPRIIEHYSITLQQLSYLYNKISLKETFTVSLPSTTKTNSVNEINDIIIHYGNKIKKIIESTFLTGGGYVSMVNLVNDRNVGRITNNNNDVNNLYFNNHNLINPFIQTDFICKFTTVEELIKYTQAEQFKEILSKGLTIQINTPTSTRTYQISEKRIILDWPIYNQKPVGYRYDTILISYKIDGLLIEIETTRNFIAHSLFTCYSLYNKNLYISDYSGEIVSISVYKTNNIDYIAQVPLSITNILNHPTTYNTYKNAIYFINCYLDRLRDKKKLTSEDIITINNQLTYLNIYLPKIFSNDGNLYVPYLDNKADDVLIKSIYTAFNEYNDNYAKYIADLTEKIATPCPIKTLIIDEKNIPIMTLNNIATAGFGLAICAGIDDIEAKTNFLLVIYKNVIEFLTSKGYQSTYYKIVFIGTMAVNILTKIKEKPKNIAKVLTELFNGDNFDFMIYIDKSNIDRLNIEAFKIDIYKCLCLIKNKLNLNRIDNIRDLILNKYNIEIPNKADKIIINTRKDYFIYNHQGKGKDMKVEMDKYVIPNYYFISYNHCLHLYNTLPLANIDIDLVRIELNLTLTLSSTKQEEEATAQVVDMCIKIIDFTDIKDIFDTIPINSSGKNNLLKLPGDDIKIDIDILFYNLKHLIRELYNMLFQSELPWLSPNYKKKLERFVGLIYINDLKQFTSLLNIVKIMSQNSEPLIEYNEPFGNENIYIHAFIKKICDFYNITRLSKTTYDKLRDGKNKIYTQYELTVFTPACVEFINILNTAITTLTDATGEIT